MSTSEAGERVIGIMRARGPSERDRWVCNADDLPPAHLWRTNRLKIQSLSLLRLTDSQSIRSIDHDPVLIARAADNLKVGAKGFPPKL